jgi:hypothetical protein
LLFGLGDKLDGGELVVLDDFVALLEGLLELPLVAVELLGLLLDQEQLLVELAADELVFLILEYNIFDMLHEIFDAAVL